MRGRWHALAAAWALTAVLALAGCGQTSTVSAATIPTATTSTLTVTTNRTSYASADPIGVTVANRTSTTYYAVDGHTGCTILQLQRFDATTKTWQNVNNCGDASAAQTQVIATGTAEPFTLAPGATTSANDWNPGIYRVGVQVSAQSDGSKPLFAYSAGFRVTA